MSTAFYSSKICLFCLSFKLLGGVSIVVYLLSCWTISMVCMKMWNNSISVSTSCFKSQETCSGKIHRDGFITQFADQPDAGVGCAGIHLIHVPTSIWLGQAGLSKSCPLISPVPSANFSLSYQGRGWLPCTLILILSLLYKLSPACSRLKRHVRHSR